ncbi:hypothetical protein IW261DRAFT_1480318 [Armillaria novae-zelandiae]|uniref:Uncharacterized protein n=1 Tax=Armillaria novae-zelandiae TaxID=153914 RepID=A0AA39UEK2_9AGAR|nr:hypothetical protein IW261DRAFT_1480318 [Armillaria novae-zelandiae]
MGLSRLTQLFHSLVHFIMDPRHLNESHMLVFSKDVYRGTASSVDNILREINSFLQYGLGHIIVRRVEYCKCRKTKSSPWEHEFLIVTVKESTESIRDESDAEAADTSPDPTVEPATTSSPSKLTAWHSPSRLQRSGAKVKRITKGNAPYALDRLMIFPDRKGIKRELGKTKFEILMTMDLTRSDNSSPVALEHLTHILQTTSRNTPHYHYIFAQCYWFAYTIWKILEMEMHPHIDVHTRRPRHCVCSAYPKAAVLGRGASVDTARTPETVKMQWDAERTRRDEEWAALALASQSDRHRAEEADRRAEEDCRRAEEAEAQVRELQAKLEASERHAGSGSAV